METHVDVGVSVVGRGSVRCDGRNDSIDATSSTSLSDRRSPSIQPQLAVRELGPPNRPRLVHRNGLSTLVQRCLHGLSRHGTRRSNVLSAVGRVDRSDDGDSECGLDWLPGDHGVSGCDQCLLGRLQSTNDRWLRAGNTCGVVAGMAGREVNDKLSASNGRSLRRALSD